MHKKIRKIFLFFYCRIQKKRIFAADLDVQWCNGSTTDSGSVSLGSNPGWTTKTKAAVAAFVFLFPKMHPNP